MKRFATAMCLFVALSLWGSFAIAQEPISYELSLTHEAHKPAILRVHANEDLSRCEIHFKGCGKGAKSLKIASLKALQSQEFSWEQPQGSYHCTISYSCSLPSRTQESYFEGSATHEMLSVAPLTFDIDLHEMSAESSQLKFRSNRPVSSLEFEVTATDGSRIDAGQKDIQPATSMGTLTWKKNDKHPALISLKLLDGSGAWSAQQLFYFQIPHTDIVFDTAKAVVRTDQEDFLRETRDKIAQIVKTHDKVSMDLYIAGYTDTVGKPNSNLKLSRARAKAIAQWFRKNGISLKIYYQGFGESVLAVSTPDETPEEKNRRAVYILTSAPPISASFPNPQWVQL